MVDIAKISMERIDNLDVTIADINADISSVETTILQNISTQIASLNAKITSIETTISSMKYVTETGSNDNGWYRKWSDGWIEQGQDFPNNVPSGTEVFFPLSFSDTNYIIVVSGSNSYNYYEAGSKTTNSVKLNSNASGPRSYYACGY